MTTVKLTLPAARGQLSFAQLDKKVMEIEGL
jgi:hypothetical protein